MNILSQLYPQLFWDIDISKLDWDKHEMLIIERLITRGSYQAFQTTEQYYGKEKMGQIIRKLKYLPSKDI